MKQLLFVYFFYIIPLPAQTKLIGYVTLQNSGKKAAFPAQVIANGASSTDISNTDGYFSLLFDQKLPGDDAKLEIKKPGYEVVNREDLDIRLPHPSEIIRPVKIYLCPSGQWQQYVDKFYKINLYEINKSYQKELSDIELKYKNVNLINNEYQKIKTTLEKKKKAAEMQAKELAEKFAQANLDDQSDRYKLAYRLFSEGKIDSVLVVLEEDKMEKDWIELENILDDAKELESNGLEKVTDGTQMLNSSTIAYIDLAKIYVIKKDWQLAEEAYKKAIQIDSAQIIVWDVYQNFMIDRLNDIVVDSIQIQFSKILDIVEQTACFAQTSNEKLEWATTYKQWFSRLEPFALKLEEGNTQHVKFKYLKKILLVP